MVFHPPAFLRQLLFAPPEDIPVHELLFNEKYGRHPIAKSPPAFADALSGKSYTLSETQARVESLARALQKRWMWDIAKVPNQLGGGSRKQVDTSKVVCIFTLNTVFAPNGVPFA